MCLSDHEIYWKSAAYDEENFIMLSGYEMACEMSWKETGQQYHIHGLLDRTLGSDHEFAHDEEHAKPDYAGLHTIQELIDEMIDRGNLVILNHPTWSRNKPEDLLQLHRYFAIEIYNHQSEMDEAVGYGLRHWDYLLSNGRKVFGIAADDAHRGSFDSAISEFFGGWISVEANRLNQEDIIDALKAGRYYSSSGPEIQDLRVENGYLKVECSPVKFIKFITEPFNGRTLYNEDAAPITSGSFLLDSGMKFVRVECVDFEGNTAWSNPVFIDELL